jgi:hypothetical protein
LKVIYAPLLYHPVTHFFMGARVAHREDGERRQAHDLLGDAAEEHVAQSLAAVRADHDEVGVELADDLEDSPGRVPGALAARQGADGGFDRFARDRRCDST